MSTGEGITGPRMDEVVLEVIYKNPQRSREGIQQIIFFSDIYTTERYKKRFTTAEYLPDAYGAYSKEIAATLNELEETDKVATRSTMWKGQIEKRYKTHRPTRWSEEIEDVISPIVQKVERWDKDNLVAAAKNHWLYEHTDFGEVMDFEHYREELEKENTDATPIDILGPTEEEEDDMPSILQPLQQSRIGNMDNRLVPPG